MTDKKLIGYIGVDSGTVWIGDPCYVMGKDCSSGAGKLTWRQLCDAMGLGQYTKTDHLSIQDDWSYDHKNFHRVEPFGEGSGMEVQTAYGDGSYPVYATLNREGRISKIEIDFEPYEEGHDEG